jgi:hypothetical protein
MKKTFEELLEGRVQISLLNEPPQPFAEEKSYRRESAREIARKRWRMIKQELREER